MWWLVAGAARGAWTARGDALSGNFDPIFNKSYYIFALGHDREFHVGSNFLCEIVFLGNTRRFWWQRSLTFGGWWSQVAGGARLARGLFIS